MLTVVLCLLGGFALGAVFMIGVAIYALADSFNL